ncbi:hypothetical protein PT974_04819 [Cladobotryum mycophilum]|uniref:Uncharacterized protein n=1 Tax=Cladobotryum mycophilum TaxID=491253 RepID=A0ABR0SQ87_9HYPO
MRLSVFSLCALALSPTSTHAAPAEQTSELQKCFIIIKTASSRFIYEWKESISTIDFGSEIHRMADNYHNASDFENWEILQRPLSSQVDDYKARSAELEEVWKSVYMAFDDIKMKVLQDYRKLFDELQSHPNGPSDDAVFYGLTNSLSAVKNAYLTFSGIVTEMEKN